MIPNGATHQIILAILGGGITGIVQVNYTYRTIKSGYRKKESQLMFQNVSKHPQKVPAPDRNDILKMVSDSLEYVKFDKSKTLKNFIGYRCAG